MIRVLEPHPNAALPPLSRVLCVLAPIRIHPRWERLIAGRRVGDFDDQSLSGWQKLLLWKSRTQYFRANPRDAAYMLGVARSFIDRHAPAAAVDVLIDPTMHDPLPEPLPMWRGDVLAEPLDAAATWGRLRDAAYDAVVLLYPDAIGVGWGAIERHVSALDVSIVLVINGRRRAFVWDAVARRMLRWRRFLDATWLVEVGLLLVLPFVSSALAARDALAKRRQIHGRQTAV